MSFCSLQKTAFEQLEISNKPSFAAVSTTFICHNHVNICTTDIKYISYRTSGGKHSLSNPHAPPSNSCYFCYNGLCSSFLTIHPSCKLQTQRKVDVHWKAIWWPTISHKTRNDSDKDRWDRRLHVYHFVFP
mmetsp:Transcript_34071/g.34583  ORF Transcript_34071/g.34583 Transcript_34071/m.34583 type:complete len:131 (+) Transcript_34071:1485-1877(+)